MALTSPATFQALTGIAEGDRDRQRSTTSPKNKFAFSQELVESVRLKRAIQHDTE